MAFAEDLTGPVTHLIRHPLQDSADVLANDQLARLSFYQVRLLKALTTNR